MLAGAAVAAVVAAGAAGCGGGGGSVCAGGDGALANAAFVFVEAPRSGERVSSGFEVTGCSSTFEATVVWSLWAKDGRLLRRGTAQGGGPEPAPFRFTVAYAIAGRQVGRLQVEAPAVTREGFPRARNVIPLVLAP